MLLLSAIANFRLIRVHILLSKADSSLLVRYPIRNTTSGLHTSTLGLRFQVSDSDINARGDLKFKCTATIASIYWKSNEKAAVGVKRKRASTANGGGAYYDGKRQ